MRSSSRCQAPDGWAPLGSLVHETSGQKMARKYKHAFDALGRAGDDKRQSTTMGRRTPIGLVTMSWTYRQTHYTRQHTHPLRGLGVARTRIPRHVASAPAATQHEPSWDEEHGKTGIAMGRPSSPRFRCAYKRVRVLARGCTRTGATGRSRHHSSGPSLRAVKEPITYREVGG